MNYIEKRKKNNANYRIAIISDYFLPRLGGIESHIKDLAYNLSRKKNKVRVITSTIDYENKEKVKEIKYFENKYFKEYQDGYYIDRITTRFPFYFPYAIKSQERIKAIIDKADVVHIHVGVISPFSQNAVRIALESEKPVLVTWHCVLGMMEKYCKHTLEVKEWVQKGAIMTAVSNFHAKQLEETFGVSFKVLSNAIDEKQWGNKKDNFDEKQLNNVVGIGNHIIERQGNNISENFNKINIKNLTDEKILYSNYKHSMSNTQNDLPNIRIEKTENQIIEIAASMRFTFRKRVIHLIKIMSKVDKKLKKIYENNHSDIKMSKTFRLSLFGSGSLLPVVKMLIKFYGLQDKVVLKGRVTKQELIDEYKAKDIYVVTCLTESFGIAALEARASGIPIIARKNTGTADFIEEYKNGLFAKDDEQMAEYIVELIENDSLRKTIKNENMSSLPRQIWKNIYDDTIEYYKQAIENKN